MQFKSKICVASNIEFSRRHINLHNSYLEWTINYTLELNWLNLKAINYQQES